MLTSTLTANGFTKRSRFSRALSLLLLVLIVWGTTVEAAHRHGSVSLTNQTVGTTSLSDPGTARIPKLNLAGCGDCLICQLHQNFSTTLITVRSDATTSRLRASYSEIRPVVVHSRTDTPQTGRAPPLA